MKYLFYIITILFLYSCEQKNYQVELKEYNQIIEKNIQVIDLESNKIYKSFKNEMTDFFYGNPVKTKPWYEKAMKVNSMVGICNKKITNIQARLKEHSEDYIKIKKYEINNLKLSIDSLQQYLLSLFENDKNDGLTYSIKKCLNYNNWTSSLFEKASAFEKHTILEKIRADIKLTELSMLWYLSTKVDFGCFRFHKIEPIVIPRSEIVPLGTPYEADIIIGLVDTTVTLEYHINNKKYTANEYKYIYKEKVTAKEGIVKRQGWFVLPQRYTGDSILIPFTIQYEVLNK